MIDEKKLIEDIKNLIDSEELAGHSPSSVLHSVCEKVWEQPKVGEWIPVSERLPDVDEYILVSFENFSVPMIGRYTVDDDDGGTFRVGDEDDSFVQHDLYVNAWQPLPEPYREESAE